MESLGSNGPTQAVESNTARMWVWSYGTYYLLSAGVTVSDDKDDGK